MVRKEERITKDWKQYYEEIKSDDEEDDMGGCNMDNEYVALIVGLVVGFALTTGIFSLSGVFDGANEEIGISDEIVLDDYIKGYYPEFEDCSIKTNYLDTDGYYVELACGKIPNRDDLRIIDDENIIIRFKTSLNPEDMFEAKAKACYEVIRGTTTITMTGGGQLIETTTNKGTSKEFVPDKVE